MLTMVVAMTGVIFAINVPPVAADVTTDNVTNICDANPDASICSDLKDTSGTGLNSTFKNVTNILLYIAGIIAVVMIIISGLRMISSRGEPESVAKGRQTLTYSVIGLVVVILAFTIVNFVLTTVGGNSNSSSSGGGGGSSAPLCSSGTFDTVSGRCYIPGTSAPCTTGSFDTVKNQCYTSPTCPGSLTFDITTKTCK